jgi:hypothetical protein
MNFYTLKRGTWRNWRISKEKQLGKKLMLGNFRVVKAT